MGGGRGEAQAPKPGKLESDKDWTIGCDNRNRCEAGSLLPEGGNWPDAPVMLGIVRDAGADADPEIWVSRAAKGRETLDFLVDGRTIASVTSVNGEASVQGPQASALATAMAKGGGMEIRAGGRSSEARRGGNECVRPGRAR